MRFDPHVDVHTSGAAGLRPTFETNLFQQRSNLQSNAAYIRPSHPRARIEIDPQLIRVIEVSRPNRVWVELDASEIDDPRESGRIIDNDLFRRPARRKGEQGGAQPRRAVRGRALLIKGLSIRAIHEAFQNDRAIVNSRESSRSHREVVANDLELCKPGLLREIDLLWVRDADLATFDQQHLSGVFFLHEHRLHRLEAQCFDGVSDYAGWPEDPLILPRSSTGGCLGPIESQHLTRTRTRTGAGSKEGGGAHTGGVKKSFPKRKRP